MEKGWLGSCIVREFSHKNWNVRSVNRLVKQIREPGSHLRKKGSGRPKSARTTTNIEYVEELAQSQEDAPGKHKSTRKLAKDLNICEGSVRQILKKDLVLLRESEQVEKVNL